MTILHLRVLLWYLMKLNFITISIERKRRRKWHLGHNEVKEEVNYKHLGVNCNKYLDNGINAKDAVGELKSTFMSTVNCGLFNDLNPLTCKTIYKAVVLPKALYGCESWSSLTPSQLLMLERVCVKYIQGLNTRTRTDIALRLLGIHTLESEIDFMKLNLFGQFCRNNVQCWVKYFFMQHLVSFHTNRNTQIGFIPDNARLLSKYSLDNSCDQFLQQNVFPSKNFWKREVKSRIHMKEIALWQSRISIAEFPRFRRLHNVYEPHWLWQIAKDNPQLLHCCRSVIQMIAGVSNESLRPFIWSLCNSVNNNFIEHCIHDCGGLMFERRRLWYEIYCFDGNVHLMLYSLERGSLTLALLGEEIVPLFGLISNRLSIFRYM